MPIKKPFKKTGQTPRANKDAPSLVDTQQLLRSLDELELSVRSQNCLQNANLQTIGELVQKTEAELLMLKGFSRRSLLEIKEILQEMGLSLGMKIES
jgi:DNA-directed RNA polymerase subunit alpha